MAPFKPLLRMISTFGLALAAAALLATWTGAATTAEPTAPSGLKSIGPLAWGPDGTLFAADSQGAAIYALKLSLPEPAPPAAEFGAVPDLDEKIAALLGTTAREVVIEDMVAHGPSKTAFLAVMRGRGEGAKPVLLRITADGKIADVPIDTTQAGRLEIGNAPAPGAKSGRRDARSLTVTDMEFVDGELLIAGLSNEEFASTLRRAAYPFNGKVASTGLEIFHGAHGEWETHAPIYTFMPYEAGGKKQILASYLCTPLAAFAVDDLKASSKLRGRTLAELGWGNIPLDMLAYERKGERFVLLTNTTRGTMKLKTKDIDAALGRPGITAEPAEDFAGVPFTNVPLGSVLEIADFDANHLLILSRALETGSLSLGPRSKEWL